MELNSGPASHSRTRERDKVLPGWNRIERNGKSRASLSPEDAKSKAEKFVRKFRASLRSKGSYARPVRSVNRSNPYPFTGRTRCGKTRF
jgi:hypothetical protein